MCLRLSLWGGPMLWVLGCTAPVSPSPDDLRSTDATPTICFQPPKMYLTGFNSSGIAVSNIDMQNGLDLFVSNYSGESVSILTGDNRGGFIETSRVSVGGLPGNIAAGDFDGNGIGDFVT